LVFLSVPWSGPERYARVAFLEAASNLESENPELGVKFFLLDEDAEECRTFMGSLGITNMTGAYSLGAGSLLWLEAGALVFHEISGLEAAAKGIARKTKELWTADPQQMRRGSGS